MSHFRHCDRETAYLLPSAVDDWLPADHLAWFVVEFVEQLDTIAALARRRVTPRGCWRCSFTAMRPARLGVGASSKPPTTRWRFVHLVANMRSYYDTRCTFRKRFLPEIERLLVEVLRIAQQMKVGTLALEGTKLHANASRHRAPVVWACAEA